ncbi:MAG: hypothetical protein JO116_24670, partial [Planctomycetaceae bacterium]|nr:hypothetical protein [Planctomycetaceae bacterium]
VTRWLNDCLGLHLTDAFCGFKAYRASALSQFEITEEGYAMPLQVWVQAVEVLGQVCAHRAQGWVRQQGTVAEGGPQAVGVHQQHPPATSSPARLNASWNTVR